jgi:hypothetical protein
VDIGAVLERKEEAARAYAVSLARIPETFIAAHRGLARFWSFHTRTTGDYEAFYVVPREAPADAALIVDWLTYAQPRCDAAEQFLGHLKTVDALLQELRGLETLGAAKDAELAGLRTLAARHADQLDAAARNLGAAIAHVDALAVSARAKDEALAAQASTIAAQQAALVAAEAALVGARQAAEVARAEARQAAEAARQAAEAGERAVAAEAAREAAEAAHAEVARELAARTERLTAVRRDLTAIRTSRTWRLASKAHRVQHALFDKSPRERFRDAFRRGPKGDRPNG